MNSLIDSLMNPPFMQDPPVKLNINAKTLGLVVFIISAVLGLLALFALFGLLFLLGALNAYAGRYALGTFAIVIGLVLTAVGIVTWLMTMIGSWRMYQGNPEGKRLVVLALAINVVVNVVNVIGSGGVGGLVVNVLVAFIVYYLVLISRFPGEAPLSATAGGPSGYAPPPSPGPPPSSYMPPPSQEPRAEGEPPSSPGETG